MSSSMRPLWLFSSTRALSVLSSEARCAFKFKKLVRLIRFGDIFGIDDSYFLQSEIKSSNFEGGTPISSCKTLAPSNPLLFSY